MCAQRFVAERVADDEAGARRALRRRPMQPAEQRPLRRPEEERLSAHSHASMAFMPRFQASAMESKVAAPSKARLLLAARAPLRMKVLAASEICAKAAAAAATPGCPWLVSHFRFCAAASNAAPS